MIQHSSWKRWLIALAVLHGIVAFAGFFAPYAPTEQDRERPYLPPMKIHLVDAQGHFHLRPFSYAEHLRSGSFDQFEENTDQAIPLELFVTGARYRLFGSLPLRMHLFGAPANRIYLLGSDAYGRDQFSRILYGGQISLLAGLLGAGLTLFFGTLIGATAGYYGGLLGGFFMRVCRVVFAPARLVRGVVLSAKERDFVRAARGFGATDGYLLRRHILPETSSVVLTQAAILVPPFVLAEMTLSFLGLGVPEPVPSWGSLLASLQQYSVLVSSWWMCAPALAIVPFFLVYLGLASALQQDGGTGKIEKTTGGT